ncbi:hypothetical protein EON82_09835 [bacterium]|nr:MAG: hypothetical protein EON82_09835 [bacterium]
MSTVNVQKILVGLAFGAAVMVPAFLPANAMAQTNHRQKTKNQWRNLGYAGAALGVAGLITKKPLLTYGGLAGAAYSAYRYEQDRKSQRAEQDRWRRNQQRSRSQRFSTNRRSYSRTRNGYVTNWRHDNGLHKGWYKNGKAHGRHR